MFLPSYPKTHWSFSICPSEAIYSSHRISLASSSPYYTVVCVDGIRIFLELGTSWPSSQIPEKMFSSHTHEGTLSAGPLWVIFHCGSLTNTVQAPAPTAGYLSSCSSSSPFLGYDSYVDPTVTTPVACIKTLPSPLHSHAYLTQPYLMAFGLHFSGREGERGVGKDDFYCFFC
jgi:hypothetical protein